MSQRKVLTTLSQAHGVIQAMDRAGVFRSSLMAEIDHCTDDERLARLDAAFKSISHELAESMDFAKALRLDLQSEAAKLDAAIKALTRRKKSVELAIERLEETVFKVIEEHPDQARFDSLGAKVSIRNNGMAKLICDLKTRSKSVSHILDTDDIDKVPPEYLGVVKFIVLDTKALKADLEAGKTSVPWARLEKGKSLYGLNTSL